MGIPLRKTPCFNRMIRATIYVMVIFIIYLISSNHDQIKAIVKKKIKTLPETRVLINTVVYPQGKHYIVPNIDLEPKEMHDDVVGDTEITLCTQTSLNNLFRITSLVEVWNGKISIAVFAFDENVSKAHRHIRLLRQCSQDVDKRVRFHLVFPTDRAPKYLNIRMSEEASNCQQLSVLNETFYGDYDSKTIRYPINVLRNVALIYARTPYVLSMDIDFLPSTNAKAEMETFLEGLNDTDKEKKLLYVLPSFETNVTRTDLLKSKWELLKTVNIGNARQFSVKKCKHCHSPTNFTRWLSLPYPSQMSVAYFVRYNNSYEPFYVAQKESLPMYDERFKGYGCDRYSQVCQAYYSGYDIAVMNNAYVVHDGFKNTKEYRLNDRKQRDHKRNYNMFLVFLSDLTLKYPNSTRKCLT